MANLKFGMGIADDAEGYMDAPQLPSDGAKATSLFANILGLAGITGGPLAASGELASVPLAVESQMRNDDLTAGGKKVPPAETNRAKSPMNGFLDNVVNTVSFGLFK